MPQSTNTTVSSNGATIFVLGSTSVTFPAGITGWHGRAVATSDAEPEVFETAKNGDGMVEQVGETTPANRMRKFQLTGYIDATFVEANVPNTVAITKQGNTYFCFIRKVGDPYPKGNFVEVALDAESYSLIQS